MNRVTKYNNIFKFKIQISIQYKFLNDFWWLKDICCHLACCRIFGQRPGSNRFFEKQSGQHLKRVYKTVRRTIFLYLESKTDEWLLFIFSLHVFILPNQNGFSNFIFSKTINTYNLQPVNINHFLTPALWKSVWWLAVCF